MKILITGATGYLGSRLCRALLDAGHAVTAVSRGDRVPVEGVDLLSADPTRAGDWQAVVPDHAVVVNLAGSSIATRWTDRAKDEMRRSRLETTRRLVEAMRPGHPAALISASGVGIYGDRGDERLVETEPPGGGFLAELARDWEQAAMRAAENGARVALARIGIVLGTTDGALAKMLPAFKLGLGGPMGTGRQWMSWIHEADLVAALVHLVAGDGLAGPFNLVAPNPVTNLEFARALGRALGRPAVVPVPALALKLMLGEGSAMVLAGQRALADKLAESGFVFGFEVINAALHDLLSDQDG